MPSSAWPDLWRLALAEGDVLRDMRASLFRLQTELFVTAPAHDSHTITAFEALALGFLPLVDESAVIEAAALLAPCPDTPDAVLARLCHRGGRARDMVLSLAPRVPECLIDEFIGAGPAEAAALAGRAALDGLTQSKLLALHDDGVDQALAANRMLNLSPTARDSLVARARVRAPLARTLLSRGDLDLWDQAALYLYADSALQELVRERIAASAGLQSRPVPRRADSRAVEELLRLAAACDVIGLESALTQALGLQQPADWRFLKPERHALLALALSAAGVPVESADRIFMTVHPVLAHSVRAIFDLGNVVRAVPRVTAMVIVEATVGSRAAQHRPRRHLPGMDPSGTPAQAPVLVRAERRASRSTSGDVPPAPRQRMRPSRQRAWSSEVTAGAPPVTHSTTEED